MHIIEPNSDVICVSVQIYLFDKWNKNCGDDFRFLIKVEVVVIVRIQDHETIFVGVSFLKPYHLAIGEELLIIWDWFISILHVQLLFPKLNIFKSILFKSIY